MDLELNEDQIELRAVAKRLLDAEAPLTVARGFLDGHGDARALWETVAELGWYAVGATDDDPFGVPGLCILAEQVGAYAAPLPLVDTAVVVGAFAGADAHDEHGERLLAGEATIALAIVEDRSGWTLEPADAQLMAIADGHFTLDASKLAVHHGAEADFIAVLALADGEPALALVPRVTAGVTATATPSLDPAGRTARVAFERVSVPSGSVMRDGDALRRMMDVAAVATAAEGIGAASTALELAVEYARERRQFGRPIGTFQSVQHILADAYILRESAWATVLHAAGVLDESTEDATEAVAIAKSHGSRAAREVVEAALQVLGGIGFTWEHDAHLLQRRALECERRFGDPLQHERVLAGLLEQTSKAGAR
jgi:alkylation response protein AidB-like acyl-CoA dehydrogenase